MSKRCTICGTPLWKSTKMNSIMKHDFAQACVIKDNMCPRCVKKRNRNTKLRQFGSN